MKTGLLPLLSTSLAGGVLPVMQIVCSRLYEKVMFKENVSQREITIDDFKNLGEITGQIDDYITQVLKKAINNLDHSIGHLSEFFPFGLNAFNFFRSKKSMLNFEIDKARKEEFRGELRAWKSVLSALAKSQADGTVTTELTSEVQLKACVLNSGCIFGLDEMMPLLCQLNEPLCKRVSVPRVHFETPEDSASVVCYSLAHDALGLPLIRSNREQEVESQLEVKFSIREAWWQMMQTLTFSGFVGLAWLVSKPPFNEGLNRLGLGFLPDAAMLPAVGALLCSLTLRRLLNYYNLVKENSYAIAALESRVIALQQREGSSRKLQE